MAVTTWETQVAEARRLLDELRAEGAPESDLRLMEELVTLNEESLKLVRSFERATWTDPDRDDIAAYDPDAFERVTS